MNATEAMPIDETQNTVSVPQAYPTGRWSLLKNPFRSTVLPTVAGAQGRQRPRLEDVRVVRNDLRDDEGVIRATASPKPVSSGSSAESAKESESAERAAEIPVAQPANR